MVRGVIARAALSSVLVLAASAQVAAQGGPGSEREETLTMAVAAAGSAASALAAAASVLWPDAPAPASLARQVPVARDRMWGRAFDAFPWPLHLRFLEAHCSSRGAVALVFEEIRPLLPLRTYAVAWRGSMPSSSDDGWGGGTGMSSVLDDPEFIHIMGRDTEACP